MHRSTSHQAGFSASVIIIAIVALAVIGGVGFAIFNKASDEKTAATTPVDSTTPKQEMPQPSGKPETPADPYAGMKQYANAEYGISFYYPNEWNVSVFKPEKVDSGPTPVEFSITIKRVTEDRYPDTAGIVVYAQPLAALRDYAERSLKENAAAKVVRNDGRDKNRQSTQLVTTVPVAGGSYRTEQYLFASGEKTISLASVNEELNLSVDADYWAKFEQVYKSLTLK